MTVALHELDEAARLRLGRYLALLEKWNPAINLVSVSSLPDAWRRHVDDSLQLLRHTPAGARTWADLGSGGGFPGMAIALALDAAGPRVTLIESDQRKVAFLSAVSRETGVDVRILAERIETAAEQQADVVSARALAPLPALLPLVARHLAPGGTALLLKGAGAEAELAEARRNWAFDLEIAPSITDPSGKVLIVKELRRV